MRTGTVIVTDIGGLGKNIFHYGDKVKEGNFPVDNFDRLVKGGYIEEDVNETVLAITEPIESEPEQTETEPANTETETKDPLSNIDFGGNKNKKRR
jgi:hypothetical protein